MERIVELNRGPFLGASPLLEPVPAATGATADLPLLAFADLEANLRTQVERIRSHPWIKDIPVHGLVYAVETGRLREVA